MIRMRFGILAPNTTSFRKCKKICLVRARVTVVTLDVMTLAEGQQDVFFVGGSALFFGPSCASESLCASGFVIDDDGGRFVHAFAVMEHRCRPADGTSAAPGWAERLSAR